MTWPVVPVDGKTADWPRKVATAVNRLQNTAFAASGTATWGSITGTLSSQTDLNSALGAKQATLVSGTNLKTVNGTTLLGAGDLSTVQTTITGNAGTATALQTGRTFAMTGDVAWTTGAFDGTANMTAAGTIQAGVVTLAKMADVATGTVFYRKTAGTGAPEVQTLATLKTDLGLTGTNSGDQTITLTGDVTGSGTGSFAATIANSAVTLAKQADVATGTVFYRKTAGTGAPEVQALATLKTDLGLTGTNSGDQTSIVGITGTKAQFNTAVTDGDILYVGDVTQYTDEMAQDAVGGMVDASLAYVDATPLLQRAALTGAITASAGSNATALGSFTIAQLSAALSDGDFFALDSGNYTPTLTNATNISSSTANVTYYQRIGSLVIVSGQVTIQATAAGVAVLRMSLPIATNLTASSQAGGGIWALTGGKVSNGGVQAATGTEEFSFTLQSVPDATSIVYSFIAGYRIA